MSGSVSYANPAPRPCLSLLQTLLRTMGHWPLVHGGFMRPGLLDVGILPAALGRSLDRPAQVQLYRRRRPLLRHLPVRRWRVDLAGADRAAVLRPAQAAPGQSPSARSRSVGSGEVARTPGRSAPHRRAQDPRRVVRAARRHRRLLRPVLSMAEAPHHPHTVARGGFETRAGVLPPAPAPRISRTPATVRCQGNRAAVAALRPAPGQALCLGTVANSRRSAQCAASRTISPMRSIATGTEGRLRITAEIP